MDFLHGGVGADVLEGLGEEGDFVLFLSHLLLHKLVGLLGRLLQLPRHVACGLLEAGAGEPVGKISDCLRLVVGY